jgi:TonB family protein
MMRRQAAAQSPSPSGFVLLAAVYAPEKKTLSESSPFFSVVVFHQPNPDCKQLLDAMVPQLEKQDKKRIENGKRFSAGSNDFYRTDFEQKSVLRHRAFLCTTAKEYELVWNAGARDEKGLDVVVSTLNSISPVVPAEVKVKPAASSAAEQPPNDAAESRPSPQKMVQVSSRIMGGLLVKKVPPNYPEEARQARIQGTVMLSADIGKEGNIVNLELLEGPIELAGSAVDAVRRWKYHPYILNGEPVEVHTQVQVNYLLAPH